MNQDSQDSMRTNAHSEKENTKLSVRKDLRKAAKEKGINLSKTLEML